MNSVSLDYSSVPYYDNFKNDSSLKTNINYPYRSFSVICKNYFLLKIIISKFMLSESYLSKMQQTIYLLKDIS